MRNWADADMTRLRARLMNPPNAVPDTGITMRNGRPVRPQPEPKPEPEPTKSIPVPALHEVRWRQAQRASLTRRQFMLWEIATALGVSAEDLKGTRMYRPLVQYRQGAMAIIARLLPGASTVQIGRTFGDRDHTTVIHAIRKMKPHIDVVAAALADNTDPSQWAQAMQVRLDAISSHARPFAELIPKDRDHGG